MSTRELDQFIKTVAALGFTFIGYDGNNHPRFKHRNGQAYSTSLTPSDHRSRRNALAQMERIAGRKLPRNNAGHYQHHRVTPLQLGLSAEERARSTEIDTLVTEAEALRCRFAELTADPSADGIEETRHVIRRYEHIRQVLAARHRIIRPIDSVEV